MSKLSTELVDILAKLPDFIASSGSGYKENAVRNAAALDDIAMMPPSQHSSVDMTAQVAQIVLGPAAVLKPGDDGYDKVVKRSWATACWLPAGCIIKLRNSVEVALALALVRKFQVKFAVRSGGHMANPGSSSIGEDGVLLDLGEMRKISLSEDRDIATVGPAATWDAVYEELEKYERTVVGGRVTDVGVAGLVLGGGMSHFTNYWGMACDNVKNFQVVLADSSIIRANATENLDLFSALRGGGPNFGIVTELELYTYPEYKLWYNMKIYSPADSEPLMKAVVEVQKAMETDDRIGLFFIAMKECFVVGLLYRSGAPNPGVFAAFDGITAVSEKQPPTIGTQSTLSRILAMPGPYRPKIGTVSVRADTRLYMRLHHELQEIMADAPASVPMTCNFQPVGQSTAGLGKSKGDNCMNIPPKTQTWLVIIVQWEKDSEAELAQSKSEQLLQKVDSVASEMGLLLDFKFMNDASGLQSPLDGYGQKSISSLKAASQKWDPERVFQKLQNGGFLLSKSCNSL